MPPNPQLENASLRQNHPLVQGASGAVGVIEIKPDIDNSSPVVDGLIQRQATRPTGSAQMPDANETARPGPPSAPAPPSPPRQRYGWVPPALRVLGVIGAAVLAWYVAGHWNRWTGAARYEYTDDANTAGDATPISAKVSGYVGDVAVADYQLVQKGQLIVEIDPSDYRAQLMQAEANLAAAQSALDNLANQKDVQRALIRQAQATIDATQADVLRYDLEAQRQRDLLK